MLVVFGSDFTLGLSLGKIVVSSEADAPWRLAGPPRPTTGVVGGLNWWLVREDPHLGPPDCVLHACL